mmetsp:Transcript_34544/g.99206  ORF Transcript_34544/g.99206 Transcript_34544/m.99206 type:complete len:339 (-) Transcript_34544:289-1305(-)
MVQPHSIAAQRRHRPQVVAAQRTPLRGVARLKHVLRRQATATAGVLRARQSPVGDASNRPQRDLTLRERPRSRRGRRGRDASELRRRGADDGGRGADARRRRGASRGCGGGGPSTAEPCAAHRTLPRCSHSLRSLPLAALEPGQVGAEATHWPGRAWRAVVADVARLADDLVTKGEQTEVQLGAALLEGGLELEEGHACEERVVALRLQRHGLEVLLNDLLSLSVGTVLPDEPRHWRELLVAVGDHLIHKSPRSLRVQTMDPPRRERLLQGRHLGAWRVVGNQRVRDAGHHVLEAESSRPGQFAIDGSPLREAPRRGEPHAARAHVGLPLCGQHAVES